MKKRLHPLLLSLTGLLISAQMALPIGIQMTDPLSGQLLASEFMTGSISLGLLNPMGLREANSHPRIDGIYALLNNGVLAVPEEIEGAPPAMLYIIGSNPNQAALSIQATGLGEQESALFVSYRGDLPVYLSESHADWQPGTFINGSQHILVPNDGLDIALVGIGGRFSDQGLTETSPPVSLDMAFKVSLTEPAGPKSGTLSFLLLPQ